MATKKARPARSRPVPAPAPAPAPALPPAIAVLAGTLAPLADAMVVTRDAWQGGGVEIILANEKFAELTGYPSATLPGRNTRLLHGPRTELLAPGAAAGGRLVTGEGWLYRRDESEFYAAWNFSPILVDGTPSGCLIGIYRDISESRRLREALLQSQKLDTVGLLAGGVAHDFNNLLSVINGYCEILATKLAGVPAAQKDLHEIHRAGLQASALSRQILEFSRRQETAVKVVNFNTLIREIAEIIRRVAGEETVVELRLASDLGNARIDPAHFQRVLLNLCFNAREAMTRGGKLTIRTANYFVTATSDRRLPEMPDGLYATMQVTDTGVGIEPAALKNIFVPFFTTKSRGTGLGLPTVQNIIRENRGHIAVRSTPGTGTTFEIFLPETAEPEETSVTKLGTLPAMRGTEHVLIIEADDILRKMIAGIFATDGYRVTEAVHAEDAAAALAASGIPPQLVLVHSHTKAGAALARRLRARNPRLRVISTSAAGTAGAILPDFPTGTMVHLPKPFALSTLMLKARSLLDTAAV
jgi:two-component system cell cycle sensor histidine kinase/response regulator CckA